MFNFGAGEILVVGLLGLILLGPRKLPDLAREIGAWRPSFTPRWSRSDWMLLLVAFVSVAVAMALLTTPGR
jgi:hypothetical protein